MANVRKMILYLKHHGYHLKRKGKKHDIYTNGVQDIALPRGGSMKDQTAVRIKTEIKRNKNKVGSNNDIQGSDNY